MNEQRGIECPAEEVPGDRLKERHEIIAMASQDFLDRPEKIATVNRNLFRALAANAIPALQGENAQDEDVDAFFANSAPETRLLISRGQQQALRSAFDHVAFIELACSVLPLLEGKESLVSSQEIYRDKTHVGDAIEIPYLGEYYRYMLTGVQWIRQPSLDFVESVRSPRHLYHQLFAAMYDIQSTVRRVRMEQRAEKSHITYQGIIRDSKNFESYQPLFLENLQDIMIILVAAQKAYISWADELGASSPQPEEIVRLVLTNLDTFSLPANMKREAALKKISHPMIRYANQPMEEKPFTYMPQIFSVVEDFGEPRLELAHQFAYLKSVSRSFCAGVITHRSVDRKGRETAERLLSAAGVPSGRPPQDPEYGRISPITILGIIGANIARDTIFHEA